MKLKIYELENDTVLIVSDDKEGQRQAEEFFAENNLTEDCYDVRYANSLTLIEPRIRVKYSIPGSQLVKM